MFYSATNSWYLDLPEQTLFVEYFIWMLFWFSRPTKNKRNHMTNKKNPNKHLTSWRKVQIFCRKDSHDKLSCLDRSKYRLMDNENSFDQKMMVWYIYVDLNTD